MADPVDPDPKPRVKLRKKSTAEKRPNWTVQEALEDGQAAVRRGSGLPLRPSAEDALLRHFRPMFMDQYKKGEDWHASRARVMMLAQLMGGLACLLTMAKDFVNKRSAPVAVDPKSALQAAEIVAFVSRLCMLGGWCPNNMPMSAILAEMLPTMAPLAELFPAAEALGSRSEALDEMLKGKLG